MSNSLSILEYYARKALPRTLIVTAVMAAAELLYIRFRLVSAVEGLQSAVSFMLIVFTAARLLVFFLIGGPSASKSNYMIRMRMLNVSENKAFRLNILVNIMAFVIVYAAQMLIVLYLAGRFTALADYRFGPQGFFSLFVDAYGGQALLPTDRPLFWVTAVAELIALAGGSACYRHARMYRRFPTAAVCIAVFIAATAYFFIQGSYALHMASFALIAAAIGCLAASDRAKNQDETKEAVHEN